MAASKKSSLLTLVVTLVTVTLIASLSLGFVYTWTKEPIEQARLAKQREAIQTVIAGYDNDPVGNSYKVRIPGGGDSLEFFPAKKQGQLIGTAVKTFSTKGYGGNIWLMVGLDSLGTIMNISVIEHTETPGLGSKMSMPFFLNQFLHKNPQEYTLKVRKDGGEIDGISGATISSRAFAEAVQRAYDTFKSQQHGNEDQPAR